MILYVSFSNSFISWYCLLYKYYGLLFLKSLCFFSLFLISSIESLGPTYVSKESGIYGSKRLNNVWSCLLVMYFGLIVPDITLFSFSNSQTDLVGLLACKYFVSSLSIIFLLIWNLLCSNLYCYAESPPPDANVLSVSLFFSICTGLLRYAFRIPMTSSLMIFSCLRQIIDTLPSVWTGELIKLILTTFFLLWSTKTGFFLRMTC